MSSMFGRGFTSSKCKTSLRLAMARIKLLRNKRDIQIKQMRKDIAQLLQTGQEPSARIRVEHISREQNIMAAYDILELFCELLTVRLPIIESQKMCPVDLKEAVSSLIFAAPRCADIPELIHIRTQFTAKYGKEFVAAAAELRPECGVNRRIIEKLSVRAPSGEVKLKLLKEIAQEFKVEWDPTDTEAELLKRPEDLLDGPKQFYGASSAPLPESPQVSPSMSDSSSFSRRAPEGPVHPPPPTAPPPPPPPPSAPTTIEMLPLDPDPSGDDVSPDNTADRPQFVPFTRPFPGHLSEPDPTVLPSRSSSSTTSSTSGKYDTRKPSSKSDMPSQLRDESHHHRSSIGEYVNVDDAVQAAAEYSRRAAAAARAAAALRKSQSLSPSPPRSRREDHRSRTDSESDEDSVRNSRKSYSSSRRRPSRKPPAALEKSSLEDGRDGSALTKGEDKEFSFRISEQEIARSSLSKRTSSDDRNDDSLRKSSLSGGPESLKGSLEYAEESTFRRNSPNFFEMRNGSGKGDVFSRNDEDDRVNTLGTGSEARAKYDVEPPPKVDPENESFWKPVYKDWPSDKESDLMKKIESGITSGSFSDEAIGFSGKSGLFQTSDSGRYGDGSISTASDIFSGGDSSLFKRSDSADRDLRRDDDYYGAKPGFANPKFDDEDYSSRRSSRIPAREEDNSVKRSGYSSQLSSSSEFWKGDPSYEITEEDEAFVKKFSFRGREDMKPLEKAKSDSVFDKTNSGNTVENIDRAGSEPVYGSKALSRPETPVSTKSRRTRLSKDRFPEETTSSFHDSHDKTDTQFTLGDPPFSSRPLRFNPSLSAKSEFQHLEGSKDSSPSSNSSPGSVSRKPPSFDDLSARFEALKAGKR